MTQTIKSCPYCNKNFEADNANQIYCCSQHQAEFVKRLQRDRAILKEEVRRELQSIAWKKNVLDRINKWYEIMNMEKSLCSLCRKSFEDQMIEHSVPLHMECRDTSVRDYRLMEADNWIFFCTGCYLKILDMRIDAEADIEEALDD